MAPIGGAKRMGLHRKLEAWNIKKEYGAFLSHFKNEAAAEAHVLKLELSRSLRTVLFLCETVQGIKRRPYAQCQTGRKSNGLKVRLLFVSFSHSSTVMRK